MIRALGLPHFGQTSRWGAGTLGVLRFWRRSVWMESGCIGVLSIISNHGVACGSFCLAVSGRPLDEPTAGLGALAPIGHSRIKTLTQRASVRRSVPCKRPRSEDVMATTVGRFTIWSIVALVALVVIALLLLSR